MHNVNATSVSWKYLPKDSFPPSSPPPQATSPLWVESGPSSSYRLKQLYAKRPPFPIDCNIDSSCYLPAFSLDLTRNILMSGLDNYLSISAVITILFVIITFEKALKIYCQYGHANKYAFY